MSGDGPPAWAMKKAIETVPDDIVTTSWRTTGQLYKWRDNVAAALAEEREMCAKIADAYGVDIIRYQKNISVTDNLEMAVDFVRESIAAAIRSRS